MFYPELFMQNQKPTHLAKLFGQSQNSTPKDQFW